MIYLIIYLAGVPLGSAIAFAWSRRWAITATINRRLGLR